MIGSADAGVYSRPAPRAARPRRTAALGTSDAADLHDGEWWLGTG
jgi:hypothetical protein